MGTVYSAVGVLGGRQALEIEASFAATDTCVDVANCSELTDLLSEKETTDGNGPEEFDKCCDFSGE